MKKIVYLGVIILAVLFLGKMVVNFDVTKISTAAANDLALFSSNLAAADFTANQLIVDKNINVKGVIFNKKKYKKNPVKIADNLVPSKDKKANLGSAKKYWKKAYINDLEGEAVNTDNLAANSVTQTGESYGTATQQTTANYPNIDYLTEQVTLTTGDSTLFIIFSGVLSINTNNAQARIILVVDGQPIEHSTRRGTTPFVNAEGERTFTLATNALVNVTAGSHIVRVGWNTEYATEATMYNHTLDVIELKR